MSEVIKATKEMYHTEDSALLELYILCNKLPENHSCASKGDNYCPTCGIKIDWSGLN